LNSGSRGLLVLVIGLALGAAAVLAFGRSGGRSDEVRQTFQYSVGGMGTGPAVHSARCGRAFDMRVTPSCIWRHGAVAGGDRYCPLHGNAMSIATRAAPAGSE
jgi:hypothetical protein